VLLVGRLLGLFDIKAPSASAPAISPALDAQRLEAKYDEIQEADYFSILGLKRSAGADEVQRAFERLSTEFDPIRFSGHPDVALQQRAQMVHAMLSEAAKALEDDRRRAEYARHLLD
jgi:preprotein translocase subunit Sec63